ncbi:MAG: energy-coupling factor ABC transporter permease [Clostridiales Family XIII bacterium]|jgi:cobalt/nickel transport system permease protein|nr:energy-coupling factor ABC transporter permease [Clostridiales Family XIII bacterium]
MHMADALLSPAVGLAMDAVAVAAVGVSAAKIKKDDLNEKKIPIMGIAGALVFAGQMINFSIPATGSSGHIGGGILLSGLLGGFPAFLSIAAVLVIQCLFFADGGLLALGCNIFNMGVVPCLILYPLLFRPLLKGGVTAKRLSVASVASAVIGLEIGAFCVVLETLFSGITELPFSTFAALMLPIHLAIGLVEGLVTAAILVFVHKMRPEIIGASLAGQKLAAAVPVRKVAVVLVALTLVGGGALSLAASGSPDGLEWAIGNAFNRDDPEAGLGQFEENAALSSVAEGAAGVQENTAFLPGYAFASDGENPAGTAVSGIVGAAITFALACAAGLIISKVKRRKNAEASA